MAKRVTVRLSKACLREIDGLADRLATDRSGVLRRVIERGLHEAVVDDVLERLRLGQVSIGKAREMAGMTVYEMLDLLRSSQVASGYALEDLTRDLRDLGRPR